MNILEILLLFAGVAVSAAAVLVLRHALLAKRRSGHLARK